MRLSTGLRCLTLLDVRLYTYSRQRAVGVYSGSTDLRSHMKFQSFNREPHVLLSSIRQ
jgi:hypothetical protein